MIQTEANDSEGFFRIVVRANRSMGWRENKFLIATLGLVSVGPAGGLAILGYWMALPFAGLELVAVSVCLYKTLKRLERQEVITIAGDLITVEWGEKTPERSVSAPRHWSRLCYEKSANPFEVGMLALLIHNRCYRLGSALGKKEKLQLFIVLRAHFETSQIRLINSH